MNRLCLMIGLLGTPVARHFLKGFLKVLEEIKFFLSSLVRLDISELWKLVFLLQQFFDIVWVF